MNLFFISIARAFTLAQPIPSIDNKGGLTDANNFAEYVVGIMPFIFGLAVVIAVVQLVIGGMQYALSEGLTSKEDAKDRIWSAIGGLFLALLSWLILNTINPDFVNPKALNIPPLTTTSTPTNTNTPITLTCGGPNQPTCSPAKPGGLCFGPNDCTPGYFCNFTTNKCELQVIINPPPPPPPPPPATTRSPAGCGTANNQCCNVPAGYCDNGVTCSSGLCSTSVVPPSQPKIPANCGASGTLCCVQPANYCNSGECKSNGMCK